jgi:hypothetical protein
MILSRPQLRRAAAVGIGTQAVWSSLFVKPSGHAWHEAAPAFGAMNPSGHVVHDPLPSVAVNDPGGHGVHEALPAVAKNPGWHTVQTMLPSRLLLPAGQMRHWVAPGLGLNVPAAQF